MKQMKKLIPVAIALIVITSCADHVNISDCLEIKPVGFWYGLLHGTIAPFSWIGSLFSDKISIYAVYNNGGWYDFGFILGIGALSTGSYESVK